jgi:hypothetical protein
MAHREVISKPGTRPKGGSPQDNCGLRIADCEFEKTYGMEQLFCIRDVFFLPAARCLLLAGTGLEPLPLGSDFLLVGIMCTD